MKNGLAGTFGHAGSHYYYMTSSSLRRALLAVVLAIIALGVVTPVARADGDPGSDVLVYQNLFVAADSNISIPQQVELGNLLTAAGKDGFPVRVAIIATPNDLGAITALWKQPASYAHFLGVELSLAYAQRLLVVMPNGFGFNWQGHSTSAAYRVLGPLHVGSGPSGLVTAAETAVRALGAASGVRIAAPATGSVPSAGAGTGTSGTGAGTGPVPGSGVTAGPSGPSVPLIVAVAAGALAVVALGWWLARRAGFRLPQRLRPAARLGFPRRLAFLSRFRPSAWPRPSRRMIPGAWLAGGFVGVVAVAIVAHAIAGSPGSAAPGGTTVSSALAANANIDSGAPLSGDAPGFTLTDQFGQPLSLSAYRGKAVVLAFNDSECTTICPLTTAALVQAKAMLGTAGSQVQLLGIDANPKATSVEDMLSYSQLHGMLYQWRYLTGSMAQLKSVWKAYSVGVTISQNSVDHEPAIFVISPQGKLARLYLTQMAYSAVPQLGQLIASEVASLLPGHPAVQSHLSYAQVGGITPATGTSLPGAGGGYVSLGPGQPRLYLFFATWAQEVTPLAGQLDALNAYQSATSSSGLPALTAVDEGGIEPSAAALPGFLASLGKPPSYPVAIDGDGQVADGYGVQGVPWFVLTSATGKVIWSWEVTVSGWPSTASLEQHIRAALGSAA
ncbi:MAG TPA: SCO family protein [Trebonia sp.]|jgi:protein SCO1/2|nr:SCO family protein [Trebonia sp.]